MLEESKVSTSTSTTNGVSVTSSAPKQVTSFTLQDIKQENNFVKNIYCVRFCEHAPSLWNYFATVGSNAVSIYRIIAEENHRVELVQHYLDDHILHESEESDRDESESYYTATWATSRHGHPVVAVGGKHGIVKVLNTITSEVAAMKGHGGLINELRTHPIDHCLVFSASKDRSVRLWNIRTFVCVAVFTGEKGHRDEVLSLDVHMLGNCFASSSMDTTVKVWNLMDPKLLVALEKSNNPDECKLEQKSFPTTFQQIPLFSTNQLHTDYVDCVRWVGDCLLTKSTNNRIVLWSPDALRYKGAPLILQEYTVNNCKVWFVKFDVNIPLGMFALGNTKGKIYLYSVGPEIQSKKRPTENPDEAPKEVVNLKDERFQHDYWGEPLATLSHTKFGSVVRQTSFSCDAKYFSCCLDDGSIQIWSIKESATASEH